MQTTVIPSTSVEYIHATITGNWTSDLPVSMAVITADTEPVTGDWKTATWDSTGAKILIGAGSTIGVLTEGTYGVWVRVTATPEVPVIYAGRIRIA